MDWMILRTSGRSTLSLARTLEEDGFEVWTPIRKQTIRVPRMNVRREITLPLLPSFVFARARHMMDLLHLSKMEERPRRGKGPAHREFSVFRYLDSIPLVSDRCLEPLRAKEIEAVPKKGAQRFDRGSRVRVGSGAFEGLKGRVERCKSGYALVIFDDWKRPAKIPTFLLRESDAHSSHVAKAA